MVMMKYFKILENKRNPALSIQPYKELSKFFTKTPILRAMLEQCCVVLSRSGLSNSLQSHGL